MRTSVSCRRARAWWPIAIAGALALFAMSASSQAGVVTELARQDVTRFVTGAVHGSRVYGGTHCGGLSAIYDYPPFRVQQSFGGESVLDFVELAGVLYSTHENGPRVYRFDAPIDAWTEVHVHDGWTYMFFGEIHQDALFLTGGTSSQVGLLRSDDGATFSEVAAVADWLWLPVSYAGRLYVLGHAGAAYDDFGAAGVVSDDGVSFAPVAALAGGAEYQTAFVWQGVLYLGTGGWTTARTADDRAQIYRFDGSERTLVLSEGMNGVTSIAAMGDKLYAALDSGWERDAGESRLYQSLDGMSWTQVETFPDPELRHLETLDDDTLVLFGGRACQYGVVYSYRETAAEPLTVLTTQLPHGVRGEPYSATLEAAYGWPPTTWALSVGALPAELVLDAAAGILAGTPASVGDTALRFSVHDALDASAESGELVLSITDGSGAGGSGAGTGGTSNAAASAPEGEDAGCGCRLDRRRGPSSSCWPWVALIALGGRWRRALPARARLRRHALHCRLGGRLTGQVGARPRQFPLPLEGYAAALLELAPR